MKHIKSKYLIILISICIGGLHFVIGPNYSGPYRIWITSYLMDILLPANMYLLAQLGLRKSYSVRKSRILGIIGTMGIGITTELFQFKGIPLFGNTFDPIDIIMYAFGTGIGILIDIKIITRWER